LIGAVGSRSSGGTEPRWYPLVVAASASTLIISNIIAVKLVELFGLTLPAAVILFPVVYILGDVLTEVYGYARARQAIWIGFGCNLLAVAAIWLAGRLPPAGFWNAQVYPGPLVVGSHHRLHVGRPGGRLGHLHQHGLHRPAARRSTGPGNRLAVAGQERL
jgi:hypothetical protein